MTKAGTSVGVMVKSLKVLIVEDEIFVGWNLESAIREMGHDVCGVAESAAEALALADQFQPDVIIIDIGLFGPGDGLTAARAIAGRLQTRLVFSSAWNDEATLQAITDIGPYACVPKPCSVEQIVEVIDRAAGEIGTLDRQLSKA